MPQSTVHVRRHNRTSGTVRRALRGFVLVVTLIFVLAALLISAALVVYTAWLHKLQEGAFALLFAVLSAQIAMNWILWRDDEDDLDD